MSDYHTFPMDPDDDDSIPLDSDEARLRANAQARKMAEWAMLSSTSDPLANFSDYSIDQWAEKGMVEARVSQIIRRCHAEIAADTPTYWLEGSWEQKRALRDAIYWALSALRDQIKAEVAR